MPVRIAGTLTALACLLLTATPMAQLVGLPVARMSSSGSVMLSPSVVAAYHFAPGGADLIKLDALVLFRGRPGWYTGSSSSSGGGVSTGGGMVWSTVARYGSVELNVRGEFDKSLLFVQGRGVDLREGNVILVDAIDEPSGLIILDTLQIEAQVPFMSGPDVLLPIINAAPELKAFLRCDVAGPMPMNPMTTVCGRVAR